MCTVQSVLKVTIPGRYPLHFYALKFVWLNSMIASHVCTQAPKIQRVHGGKSSRSPGSGIAPVQSPSSEWDSIIKFLDSLKGRLRGNYVI